MRYPVNPRRMPVPSTPPRAASDADQIAPPRSAWEVEGADLAQSVAFKMGLVLIFIRFSIIHQLLTSVLHVNLYLLYLFGVPTLVGLALVGGIQRTLRGWPAIFWALFTVWLFVELPFSSWRGGSAGALNAYVRTDFPMLFVIAGLTLTWRECRSMMRAIACGAVVIMLAARAFHNEGANYADRLALNAGAISNSNDYACHLLLVLPFVIWVALVAKSKVFRLAAWGVAAYGVLLVVKTASRGALVALAVGALYWLIRGTLRQRIALLAAVPIAVAALVAFVPRSSLIRIVSFSAEESSASQEALDSSLMRWYLLRQSIVYTLQHPLFGVGMAQFSTYEGEHNQIVGEHGYWHEAHNTYTQVSSECGLPALALYIAGIVSTFVLVNRVFKRARGSPEFQEIRTTAFCILLALVMYCTAITFVNFAYFFYLPAMASLAIAVSRAAERELNLNRLPAAPRQLWAPQRKPVTPAAR